MTKYVKAYLDNRIKMLAEDDYTRGELSRREKEVVFFQAELDRYRDELDRNATLRKELVDIWRDLPNDDAGL